MCMWLKFCTVFHVMTRFYKFCFTDSFRSYSYIMLICRTLGLFSALVNVLLDYMLEVTLQLERTAYTQILLSFQIYARGLLNLIDLFFYTQCRIKFLPTFPLHPLEPRPWRWMQKISPKPWKNVLQGVGPQRTIIWSINLGPHLK
jgi:hypothetical protein